MSYKTVTIDVDVDVVETATMEGETYRVILEDDNDATLDGDCYPMMIVRERDRWVPAESFSYYYPNVVAYADDLARAANYFGPGEKLERWARLFYGAEHVAEYRSYENWVIACDSDSVRELRGLESGWSKNYTAREADRMILGDIPDFLEGETYGAIVQKLEGDDPEDVDAWSDVDSLWGLIGREWAEEAAWGMLEDVA